MKRLGMQCRWREIPTIGLEEIVKILETMLDYQLYQLAFVLMEKLKWDGEIGEVFYLSG